MKLYHVIRSSSDTMFVSDKQGQALKEEAEFFLKEENKYHGDALQIIEITSIDQIPKSWDEGCYLWNIEEEISAQQWLYSHNDAEEYQEYLRLKKKFES